MALYAQLHGVTNIKVEQMCEWSQHEDDEHENEGETDGGVRDVVITLSKHKTEAIVPFNGLEKHTVSPSSPSTPSCVPLKSEGRKTDSRYQSPVVNPSETQSHPIA
jgi:hypothetical protein